MKFELTRRTCFISAPAEADTTILQNILNDRGLSVVIEQGDVKSDSTLDKNVLNAIVSSDFAEMTDVTRNWGSLAPEQIYENLLSVVYVGGSREELLDAFAKARDALMEMGALSTLVTHEMSQHVDKIKKHPIETQELVEIIQKWKSAIKE